MFFSHHSYSATLSVHTEDFTWTAKLGETDQLSSKQVFFVQSLFSLSCQRRVVSCVRVES